MAADREKRKAEKEYYISHWGDTKRNKSFRDLQKVSRLLELTEKIIDLAEEVQPLLDPLYLEEVKCLDDLSEKIMQEVLPEIERYRKQVLNQYQKENEKVAKLRKRRSKK